MRQCSAIMLPGFRRVRIRNQARQLLREHRKRQMSVPEPRFLPASRVQNPRFPDAPWESSAESGPTGRPIGRFHENLSACRAIPAAQRPDSLPHPSDGHRFPPSGGTFWLRIAPCLRSALPCRARQHPVSRQRQNQSTHRPTKKGGAASAIPPLKSARKLRPYIECVFSPYRL